MAHEMMGSEQATPRLCFGINPVVRVLRGRVPVSFGQALLLPAFSFLPPAVSEEFPPAVSGVLLASFALPLPVSLSFLLPFSPALAVITQQYS